MDKALFANPIVLVQGITGSQGSFHTRAMLTTGTSIVAGTSPTKHGTLFDGAIPVYRTAQEAVRHHPITTSIIFVPAPHAKAAIFEAIEAQIELIICITEGIPVHDMLAITERLRHSRSRLIGPNSPGVLIPGVGRFGIIPDTLSLPGAVGIVSRSGTLTYEAMAGLSRRGIGQKYIIGIGGDPIKQTGFIDCLSLFQDDPEVSSIVMIGEIGGTEECEAADYIAQSVTKPVHAYIAGHAAPAGVQLGHAGAILGSTRESAMEKTAALAQSGATTAHSITELVASLG